MQGFLALGLLVGVTGLGVVTVRAVRERRRTLTEYTSGRERTGHGLPHSALANARTALISLPATVASAGGQLLVVSARSRGPGKPSAGIPTGQPR
jgi:hypothetical protein